MEKQQKVIGTAAEWAHLLSTLPPGTSKRWLLEHFTVIRAGKYLGLKKECPLCKATPPSGLTNRQRVEWITKHLQWTLSHLPPEIAKLAKCARKNNIGG